MFFTVKAYERDVSVLTESSRFVRAWRWQLLAGSEAKPGDVIAVGPTDYIGEAEARSAVASFRKSASGVKFAKVVAA